MSESNLKKKDLAWGSLGFDYIKTDYRFTATNRDGKWSDGELITDEIMRIHEGSPALHYAQQCFEGLKAQTAKDGSVLLFRPELNAERLHMTAERLMMPPVPRELFLKGVEETVRANYAWIPPYGSGASLYIRPLLIGVGENMGLRPAKEYDFRVIVSPVGPYYKGGGISLISLAVTEFDRAAPLGTGKFKAGANYAGGLLSTQTAKDMGANEALYLDSAQRKYLDEAGSANILLAMTGNRFVTPRSNAILPSVTRRSIMTLAKDELKMTIEERPVAIREEMAEIEEMAACGTAAVISPVGKIWIDGQWHLFYGNGEKVGPVMKRLYDSLTQIQKGEKADPFGWTTKVNIG
ncbi:branched-chain amino acid aminotransferase [bacterium]|nr:branched-chain amino acid aminotransferase [bacterium]